MTRLLLGTVIFLGFFISVSVLPAFAQEQPVLLNPLTGFGASPKGSELIPYLQGRFAQLLGVLFGLLAILSVFPTVIGGIDLITSQGRAEQVEKGKKTLSWGLIGLFLGLGGIGLYFWFIELLLPPS